MYIRIIGCGECIVRKIEESARNFFVPCVTALPIWPLGVVGVCNDKDGKDLMPLFLSIEIQ